MFLIRNFIPNSAWAQLEGSWGPRTPIWKLKNMQAWNRKIGVQYADNTNLSCISIGNRDTRTPNHPNHKFEHSGVLIYTKMLKLHCRSQDLWWCTDTSASRHFGTDHRGSHACQRRQLRSGRGRELKAVDVYVPLSLNCGFWSQLSGATVRSQLLWRMLRVIIITVMV